MFKFQVLISGPGAYAGYLIKEINRKDIHVGGFQVDQQNELHLSIYKGKELTANELILLLSQMIQNDKSVIDKKIYINEIDNE